MNKALSSLAEVTSTGLSAANYYALVFSQQRIIEHLTSYLAGETSVRDLSAAMAREMVTASEPDAGWRHLAYLVEHRLAEFTNGDWSEDELKELFRPLARRYVTTLEAAPVRVRRRTRRPVWTPIRTGSLAESA